MTVQIHAWTKMENVVPTFVCSAIHDKNHLPPEVLLTVGSKVWGACGFMIAANDDRPHESCFCIHEDRSESAAAGFFGQACVRSLLSCPGKYVAANFAKSPCSFRTCPPHCACCCSWIFAAVISCCSRWSERSSWRPVCSVPSNAELSAAMPLGVVCPCLSIAASPSCCLMRHMLSAACPPCLGGQLAADSKVFSSVIPLFKCATAVLKSCTFPVFSAVAICLASAITLSSKSS
mmetsp:Transcript_24088/g.38780  ORF Transcript_24088/g.38780 Transcript_24088/m.38780 type:complete len:234 (-) Transcript_24088:413-1114(-)